MKKLRQDAEKAPVTNIVIVLLLVVGFASFPVRETAEMLSVEHTQINRYLFTAAFRAIFCAVMLYLIYAYGFQRALKPKIGKIRIMIPCFLVVINNFPVIALATGDAKITAEAGVIALYLLQTFFIAAFEELAFRGIVFPLCRIGFRKKKYALFWSAAVSSALFGGVHLVNLIGGAALGSVLLQVGYSFLLGGMCAVTLIETQSLLMPVTLHFLFNAGGLLVEELGTGNIVNTPTVFITVILAVAVTTLMLYCVFTAEREAVDALYAVKEEDGETVGDDRAE